MIFSNKILTDEIRDLRAENAHLREMILELIDKFMFNKQPERIQIKRNDPPPRPVVEEGAGDPVSVAERLAYEASTPKERE